MFSVTDEKTLRQKGMYRLRQMEGGDEQWETVDPVLQGVPNLVNLTWRMLVKL